MIVLNGTWEYIYHGLKFDISHELKKLLELSGKSIEDLALDLDVYPDTLKRLFNGSSNVSLKTIAKIAYALGFDVTIEIKPRKRIR